MAKRLPEIMPFDPVERALMREAAQATVHAPSISATSVVPPSVVPAPRPLPPKSSIGLGQSVAKPIREAGIAKRFMLTREEDTEFSAFLGRLEARCKTKIPVSAYVRSAIQVLNGFEEAIAEQMAATAPGRLPSNHDQVAMSMYEEWCTRCMMEAVRKERGTAKSRN